MSTPETKLMTETDKAALSPMSKSTATYSPDYAVPPGATLLETIEDLGLTQTELAQRMGRPLKTINEIINGKAEITAETSIQLERVTGIPAAFWNNAEATYQERKARLQEQEQLAANIIEESDNGTY